MTFGYFCSVGIDNYHIKYNDIILHYVTMKYAQLTKLPNKHNCFD